MARHSEDYSGVFHYVLDNTHAISQNVAKLMKERSPARKFQPKHGCLGGPTTWMLRKSLN